MNAKPIPEDEMFVTYQMSKRDGTKVDLAQSTKMPWCTGKYTLDSWPTEKFKQVIGEYHNYEGWADAAEHLCEHKEDPTWVRQATYLVQRWMNADESSQAEAEKAIIDKIASLKFDRSPAGQAKIEEKKFEFAESELNPMIDPDPGVDKASITGKPAWCDVVPAFPPDDRWNTGRISRTVDGRYGIQGTIEGAAHICQRPTDTTWKQYAQKILQKWMNWTHQSQADAEKSLRARVQDEKFAKERTELCKALEVETELGGQERTYGEAKLELFGCKNENQSLWQYTGAMNTPGVGYYLDGDLQTDELMRAYWLFGYVRDTDKELPAKNADENLPLLYYAIAQQDMEKLDTAAIEKTLSAAPYNDYARVVMNETLSVLKGRKAFYEKAVDKLSKGDEDYTAILRTAPKQAFAQWDKLSAQWKDELQRSHDFELLLSKPSRKVLKGCSEPLTKDAEKVVKSFKTNVYQDLVEKLGADPIASLLFRRLALCDAYEKVWGASGALDDVVKKGRSMRGPRSLAYYAIVDAIAAAQKDRPRLLLGLSNFFSDGGAIGGKIYFDANDFRMTGHAPREWDRDDNASGVIASTKKVDDGILVTFKTVKIKWPDYDCVDDIHHPLRVNSDGRIEYYQNCKATGKINVQDNTPSPIVVSPMLAAGAKAGLFVRFDSVGEQSKSGNSFGIILYSKKSSEDKKIGTLFGFAL